MSCRPTGPHHHPLPVVREEVAVAVLHAVGSRRLAQPGPQHRLLGVIFSDSNKIGPTDLIHKAVVVYRYFTDYFAKKGPRHIMPCRNIKFNIWDTSCCCQGWPGAGPSCSSLLYSAASPAPAATLLVVAASNPATRSLQLILLLTTLQEKETHSSINRNASLLCL